MLAGEGCRGGMEVGERRKMEMSDHLVSCWLDGSDGEMHGDCLRSGCTEGARSQEPGARTQEPGPVRPRMTGAGGFHGET